MVSQRVLCRKFVGRTAELEHLSACRRKAGESRGGGIIVLGEAGIGKSRLVREYRERYCASSVVAAGNCHEFGQGPFGPLSDILRQLDRSSASPLDASSKSKGEQLAAVLASLESSTARRMTTLIVEDVHWAQIELLQMLATLSHWAANRRLLLILTARDGEVPRTSPRFRALARLSRETSSLRIDPLEPGEISDLIDGALSDPEGVVSTEMLNDVRRRAGGNPLFAEELLRHALNEQQVHPNRRRRTRSLPLSVQGVIRERLELCERRDRTFLSAASVFGQRFHLDLLADVFALDRSEALASLGRLIELQLVDASEDPLAYEFRHALARDVVYCELIPAEAHALHLRLAEAVESAHGSSTHVELLAHSFWEAGLLERAAPYCEAAGDVAVKQYAYEDATLWFERAATAFGDRSVDLGRVLVKASAALNRLNEPKRAVPLYERAIATLVASNDFDAAVRMGTYLGGTLYNDGRENDAFEAYEAALRLAIRSRDPTLEGHVRIRFFSFYVIRRRVAEASDFLASIDEATLDPMSRDTFEYYLSKAKLHGDLGEAQLRRTCIAFAFETLERRGAPPYERRFAHGTISVDSLGLGEMDEARRHAELGLDVARRIRSDVPYMLSLLAEVEERAGNFRAARKHLAAITAVPEFLSRFMRTTATIRIALAAGDDVALDDAIDLDLLREAERGGHGNTAFRLTVAYAAAFDRRGRHVEAAEFAERAIRRLANPFGLAWEIIALANLLPARAAALRAVVSSSEHATTGSLNLALCSLLDAVTAHLTGDVGARTAFARDGAEHFLQIGWPMPEARCRELMGDRNGALTIYRRLGCAADLRRIERDSAPGDSGALTPRERELAQLVAEGKNNREAADALSISLKAVEKYLTSIYRKLGVTSRSQLTGFFHSGRLRKGGDEPTGLEGGLQVR